MRHVIFEIVALALLLIAPSASAQQALYGYAGRPADRVIILIVNTSNNTVDWWIGNVGPTVDPTKVHPCQLVHGGVFPLKKPFSAGIAFDGDNNFTHYDLVPAANGSMDGRAWGMKRSGGYGWNWDIHLVPTTEVDIAPKLCG